MDILEKDFFREGVLGMGGEGIYWDYLGMKKLIVLGLGLRK